MLRNFLLGATRNLWRNKLNSLINIASLALGFAVFSFAFLYIKRETGINHGWPDADRIHRLVIDQRGLPGSTDGTFDSVNARVFPAFVDGFPDIIDRATRVYPSQHRQAGVENGNYHQMAFVDRDFADIFQHEVVSGSLEQVLQEPGFIAVSTAVAERNGWTLGTSVTFLRNAIVNGVQQEGQATFEVAAIYRVPPNISQPTNFQMLALIHDSAQALFPQGDLPWNNSNRIWLKLKPGTDLNTLHASLPTFIDRVVTAFNENLPPGDRISNHLTYRLQPVTDMYFNPTGLEGPVAGDAGKVLTIAAIGILVLLAGCSNVVSLSLAAVLDRRREIGIRKANGASPTDIAGQHVGEALLLALLSLVPALLLVDWLLVPFATLLNIRRGMNAGAGDYFILVLIAMLVGLLNGAYPALVLSRVKPQQVLKAVEIGSGRSNVRLRTLLVSCQYCFALSLMIGTLALFAQLQVVRAQPLGFNPDDVLFLRSSSQQEFDRSAGLSGELALVPGVATLVQLLLPPNTNFPLTVNSLNLASKQQDIVEATAQQMGVVPGFFDLLQIPLLAGRQFDAVRDRFDPTTRRYEDEPEAAIQEARIMLNRAATRALGFDSPEAAVDQQVFYRANDRDGKMRESPFRVIGVMEDSMYASFRRKPGPEVYARAPSQMSVPLFLIKLAQGADPAQVQQELKRIWQEVTGAPLQSINYLDTELDLAFNAERNESKLLLYCAALALFLSSIGLYGLAAYSMARNIKEVGVRKVLGAELASITGLFLWRYARPVLLANLVAWPVALYFVLQWLERFPYQMEKVWLLPLGLAASILVLLIAMLAVMSVVLKAARQRPVRALRYE